MRAGLMDRRLQLRHRSSGTRNDHGEQVFTWSTYDTVWGRKVDIGRREFFAAQQTQAERTTTFEIHYRSDVLTTDKIVCEGVTYDISGVSEIRRRKGLQIFARATVQ